MDAIQGLTVHFLARRPTYPAPMKLITDIDISDDSVLNCCFCGDVLEEGEEGEEGEEDAKSRGRKVALHHTQRRPKIMGVAWAGCA